MTKPIVLLGEARGANEDAIKSSFVGSSGIELLKMLNEAQVIELTSEDRELISRYYDKGDPRCLDCVWNMHPEVYRTNVFNFHPYANDISSLYGPKQNAITGYPVHKGGKAKKQGYIQREYIAELERLGDELVDLDPNLIIAMGNTPLWAMCGTTGISKLRGTTLVTTHTAEGFKVLPVYHPAAILQQWEMRPPTIIDLMKAKREAEFPEIRRMRREIWISPEIGDLEIFYQAHIAGCEMLSVDIENPGGPISEIGLGHKTAAIVIPFVDHRKKDNSYWRSKGEEILAVKFIKRVLEDRSIKKVMQNGLHDVSVIWRYWGIRVYNFEHDTMLLHHALQPESLKGLGFLGSIYTDEGAWKQMRKFTKSLKRDD